MENEALIRLSAFLGLFVLFTAIETLLPRRDRVMSRKLRWTTNLSIIVIDIIATRAMAIVLPFLAVGAAIDAQSNGIGLLNAVSLPNWLAILLSILVLDLAIWAQHMIFHKIPLLWRIHRVHHADRDLDVTSALRFHPIEIAMSMIIKIGMIYVLGPPAIAVILFEIILNGSAMFNHANMRLPLWLDRILRVVLVTPDMHRVHHSVHRHEADSNYGFCLSIWDRMFRTYTAQPQDGHDGMVIGLEWQDERPGRLWWCLRLPFKR